MEIIRQPRPYSPAFRDILYTVALDQSEKGAEISIFDSPVTRKIGIKKTTEAPLFTLNVADYVRSQIDLRPLPIQPSGIVRTPEREIRSCIASGDRVCTTPHIAGIVEAGTGRMLTESFERRIGPGDQDEIAWVAEPGPVSARALFRGAADVPEEVFLGRYEVPGTEPVALVLNASHLANLLAERQSAWGDFHAMTVEIYSNYEQIAGFDYTLCPENPDGVRMCWWNRYGGIDHYRFEAGREQGVDVERSAVRIGDRNLVLASRLRKTGLAVAARTTRAGAERLAEIAAAPQVWLVEGERFIPVEITEKQIVTHNEELTEIGFRFTHTRAELYPAF
jgi:hypothetical protein